MPSDFILDLFFSSFYQEAINHVEHLYYLSDIKFHYNNQVIF